MIRDEQHWRNLAAEWWDGPLPTTHRFGLYYPWQTVAAHSLSRTFRAHVQTALRVVREARQRDVRWLVSLSGGKDSTALALLLDEAGWDVPAVSARDGFCWPGEDRYLQRLGDASRRQVHMARVDVDLVALAHSRPGSLLEDHEDRRGYLSGPWFRALDEYDETVGATGKLWGVRAGENDGRRMNRIRRGVLYQRDDGMHICAPLSDWSAIDVHAYIMLRGVPIGPTYLCVDRDPDPWAMRHAWWVRGGRGAAHHYRWLRRWWPQMWDRAVAIDPRVADVA